MDKKIYDIIPCPTYHGLGLCNQLCIILNAIENAFQITSLGVGVIWKQNVDSAEYGGRVIDHLPQEGYHKVHHDVLLNGEDPRVGRVKELRISWKHSLNADCSVYKENQQIYWIDSIPSMVRIYVDKFMPNYNNSNHKIQFSDILDLDAMNILLKPLSIQLYSKDFAVSSYSIEKMDGPIVPRYSLLFKNIINFLRFHPDFYKKVDEWVADRSIYNIVHLRNEDDAIRHWSKLNNINTEKYEEILTKTYIHHIQSHIEKDKLTIILTGRTNDNPIIEWMRREGYRVDFLKKVETGREIRAIYDLIIATKCQSKFIGVGVFDFEKGSKFIGSTFSFFISKILQDNVSTHLIDIDNICANK